MALSGAPSHQSMILQDRHSIPPRIPPDGVPLGATARRSTISARLPEHRYPAEQTLPAPAVVVIIDDG